MTLRPLHDKVFVRRLEPPKMTEGGLHIPEVAQDAQQKAYEGVIVAVGSGRESPKGELVPMQSKKGDRVLYPKYTTEVTITGPEGETLYVVLDRDLLAIYE